MMVSIVVALVQLYYQAGQPAYTCHRWRMHSDQSITCENGERFPHGFYRFERGSGGMVAIVERP